MDVMLVYAEDVPSNRSSSQNVLGPFTALGRLPVNVLGRHLDIAGLTVDAAFEVSVLCFRRLHRFALTSER